MSKGIFREKLRKATSIGDVFLTRHFSGSTLDYRQILAIFLPLLIDQAFLNTMNMLNTAMISSSGVAAVSAVNMVDSLNIFLVNVFIAISTGGTIVVAQYKGRGDMGMIPKAVASSISGVFSMAAVIGISVLVFNGPVLSFLFGSAEPAVLENGRLYLIGSCASFVGISVMEAVCGALRGLGETRSSLVLMVTMNLTYVILNLILIRGFGLGIIGMVIALLISRYLAGALSILFLVRRNTSFAFEIRDLFRIDWSMLRRIFLIGMPFAAEQMFFNGGKLLTQNFIIGMGTNAMATNAICASITALIQVPANSISYTAITVVGQCAGRKDVEQARRVTRSFFVTVTLSLAAAALLILPFVRQILILFSPPEVIVGDIVLILVVNASAQVLFWAASFLMPAVLRAGGDSRYTSIMSMLSMWLFRVVLGYLLGVVLHIGILGIWLAMNLEWGVRGLIFTLRFRGDKWYRHKVID